MFLLGYTAPELFRNLKHAHTFSAEWFSLGVTMYELLTTHRPYDRNAIQMLPYEKKEKAKRLKTDVNASHLHGLEEYSDECRLLVQGLLISNPQYRLGATNVKEIKNHPFFKDFDWNLLRERKWKAIPFKPNVHKANCDGTFDVRAFFEEEEVLKPLPPNQNELFKGYEYNVYVKENNKAKTDLGVQLNNVRLIDSGAYISRREHKRMKLKSYKNELIIPEIEAFIESGKYGKYPEVNPAVEKIIEHLDDEEVILEF